MAIMSFSIRVDFASSRSTLRIKLLTLSEAERGRSSIRSYAKARRFELQCIKSANSQLRGFHIILGIRRGYKSGLSVWQFDEPKPHASLPGVRFC